MLNYLPDKDYTYPESAVLYSEHAFKQKNKQSNILISTAEDAQFSENAPFYLETKDVLYVLGLQDVSLLTVPYPYEQETIHRRLYKTPKCNLVVVNSNKESLTPHDLQKPINVVYTFDKELPLPFLASIQVQETTEG